jgi:hypothetical protein
MRFRKAAGMAIRIVVLAGVISCCSGCGILRNIEQWKCDHWGMCHFGVEPTPAPISAPCPSQCNSATTVPTGY